MKDTPRHGARSEGATGDSRSRESDADRHARRAGLYGYVATALRFPERTTVGDLTDEEVRASISEAGRELGLAGDVEALLDALDGADADSLEPAYNDLFGLPDDGGTYPVVPYEAEYTTDGDVGESQRRIATVVGLLEQFGLEASDGFDERQDHVAVELELMQLLATQRATALADGDDVAAERLARAGATVLDEHLVDFVPPLAHAVTGAVADAEGEAHDAYARAAELAARLVETDAATHPEPIDPRTGGSTDV